MRRLLLISLTALMGCSSAERKAQNALSHYFQSERTGTSGETEKNAHFAVTFDERKGLAVKSLCGKVAAPNGTPYKFAYVTGIATTFDDEDDAKAQEGFTDYQRFEFQRERLNLLMQMNVGTLFVSQQQDRVVRLLCEPKPSTDGMDELKRAIDNRPTRMAELQEDLNRSKRAVEADRAARSSRREIVK